MVIVYGGAYNRYYKPGFLQDLENKKLTDLVISQDHNFEITLVFEYDYKLILKPDLENDSDIADWELLTPNGKVIQCFAGNFSIIS